MKNTRLTRYEQEKLFQAVIDHERGFWKSHADSLLANFCDIVMYPFEFKRTGKMPSDLRYMEEGIRFKQTYARMKQEYIRLKQSKLLMICHKQDRVLVKLTNKGFLRIAKQSLLRHKKKLPGGQKIFVSFDIPEVATRSRDAFRHFLKSSDFTMLQHSVWMTDQDVGTILVRIVKDLKITKWVSVIAGKVIDE